MVAQLSDSTIVLAILNHVTLYASQPKPRPLMIIHVRRRQRLATDRISNVNMYIKRDSSASSCSSNFPVEDSNFDMTDAEEDNVCDCPRYPCHRWHCSLNMRNLHRSTSNSTVDTANVVASALNKIILQPKN